VPSRPAVTRYNQRVGWRELPWISFGAVLGACARYLVSRASAALLSPAFPYGTLAVNISGSLLLGFFLIWTTERALLDPRWRLFLAIGFCGSYTTFSSYAFETFSYLEQGHWLLLTINVLGNNLLCLAAVMAGAALARWL
jgi:fluoride exporter